MAKFVFKKRYSLRTIAIKTSISEAKKIFNQIDAKKDNIITHRRVIYYNKKCVCVQWNDCKSKFLVYIWRDNKNRIYVVDNPSIIYYCLVKLYMFVLTIFVR